MERRGGGRGGRSWRPRESTGGSRPAPSSSSSSASYGDRWRPSSSRASQSASKSGGDLREGLEGSTKVGLAEYVADQDVSTLVGTCPDMCPGIRPFLLPVVPLIPLFLWRIIFRPSFETGISTLFSSCWPFVLFSVQIFLLINFNSLLLIHYHFRGGRLSI